ncbi:MAG: adenylyl-sulfate kinase [Chthoniobacterales bacterium]
MKHAPLSTHRLRIVIVGHVDHGKSTLIGRLLYDTGSLPDEKIESIKNLSEAEREVFEFAFLLDSFSEEQAQNITIDTTQIPFHTAKRDYMIIDVPGHQEFLKNMMTGAASADAALLLIDATEGIQEQTRRHVQLLKILGIREVIVAINKMDRVCFSSEIFAKTSSEIKDLLSSFKLQPQKIIPLAAKQGLNITSPSLEMSWYKGATILESLDDLAMPSSLEGKPLRFVVQDVYREKDRRLIVGRLESGKLNVGEEIIFWPAGKKARVKSIECWNVSPSRLTAVAGQSIAITIENALFVERGNMASASLYSPSCEKELAVRLFWFHEKKIAVDQVVTLQLTAQRVEARVVKISRCFDGALETSSHQSTSLIKQNNVADVTFFLEQPLVCDAYDFIKPTGRLAILLDQQFAGTGIILKTAMDRGNLTQYAQPQNNFQKPSRTHWVCHGLLKIIFRLSSYVNFLTPITVFRIILKNSSHQKIKSDHVTWYQSSLDPNARKKMRGHAGVVIWLTGLSGSGKSTLANNLELKLYQRNMATFVLDGDNLRHGLCADLGFSMADRRENIRRTGEVAKLFAEAGLVVICALISPLEADRKMVRASCRRDGIEFIEIFVDASLAVCEERDPRGLYRKARAGEIKEFTGVHSSYEKPTAPDLHLKTGELSLGEALERLDEFVSPFIKPSV